MYARAHFAIGLGRKLLAPSAAVVRRSEVSGIYVVRGERVQFRQVRLGEMSRDGMVEVLAGLEAGDRIALEPVKAGMYLKSEGARR